MRVLTVPCNASIVLQLIVPLGNESVHSIPSQVLKKEKRNTCMLILEMWHDILIIPTFLLGFLFG